MSSSSPSARPKSSCTSRTTASPRSHQASSSASQGSTSAASVFRSPSERIRATASFPDWNNAVNRWTASLGLRSRISATASATARENCERSSPSSGESHTVSARNRHAALSSSEKPSFSRAHSKAASRIVALGVVEVVSRRREGKLGRFKQRHGVEDDPLGQLGQGWVPAPVRPDVELAYHRRVVHGIVVPVERLPPQHRRKPLRVLLGDRLGTIRQGPSSRP